MSSRFRFALLLAIAAAALLLAPGRARAQAAPVDTARELATRQQLTEEAAAAQRAGRAMEAAAIRHRLTEGDFREGDRILFSIQPMFPGFSDTLIVRAGGMIELPQIDDFNVSGVLRSELAERLTAHLTRFLREPRIRVTPLIRLAVIGSVVRPGFYYVGADSPLNDILMSAGGPASNANLDRVEIKRGSTTVVDSRAARDALARGFSADRLSLATGDQITIGEQRRISWTAIISTVLGVAGVALTVARSAGGTTVATPNCPLTSGLIACAR